MLLLISPAVQAQVDLSTVTARAGIIRTLQPDYWHADSRYLWSIHPEVEVGGKLFTPYFSWGLSWCYWSDGLDRAIFMDSPTYGQSGNIVILRIGFQPQKAAEHWPIPLKIFGGVAEHIVYNRYVGGMDQHGRRGSDATLHATTAYGGLSIAIPFNSFLALEAEAAQIFPLGVGDADRGQKGRRNYALGIIVGL